MNLIYWHDLFQRFRKSCQNVRQQIVVQMDACGSVIRTGM